MLQDITNAFSSSIEGTIAAGLAVILFVWMYIRTALQLRMAGKEQLERLQQSLLLYSRVTGPLGEMLEREETSLEDISHLIFLLEECKAAPLLTSDLHEQMNAYIKERDQPRLANLYKSWVREVNRRIKEQSTLLRKWDHRTWGFSFWLLLKPAFPFIAIASILMWVYQLTYTLSGLPTWDSSPWDIVNVWARLISCLIATASLYIVLMYTQRKPVHFIYTILYVFISIVALFHMLGLNWAIYILATQGILYLAGFSLNTQRSRKDRPYAGRDLVSEAIPSLTAEELNQLRSKAYDNDVPPLPSRSKGMNK
ncbi:hypothetical protein LPB68_09710 [Paenibacillus crassostreae]|nr:hypothetical protein LPB68_09710 [Paenibacillus crassostreae]